LRSPACRAPTAGILLRSVDMADPVLIFGKDT